MEPLKIGVSARLLYPDARRIVEEAGTMVGLSAGKITSAIARLDAERGDLPIDVPDPFFKGPF